MKPLTVVAISDTHGFHHSVPIPEGDILIHCGDYSGNGSAKELREFNKWLGTLPHPHKIVIAGNHDVVLERIPQFSDEFTNAVYLRDEEILVEGLKIYGSPWQPEYNNWAFNLPRGNALRAKWAMIPDDLDILITHGPPHKILDDIHRVIHQPPEVIGKFDLNVGCEDLLQKVRQVEPGFHIFGHIHEDYGIMDKPENMATVFINASTCNGQYEPVNPPIVFVITPKSRNTESRENLS
ncbi:MAG: metallophosphatase domain-containing protein [SAR324 cluster bacterium]|nr:metallophosphatase domain-containing protein [SAR324 cluster bacterium]